MYQSILPNTVARATINVLNPQIGSAWTDRDAIISGSDVGVQNRDHGRLCNVNAVCVRATAGGQHRHSMNLDIVAVVDNNVEHLTIDYC